MTNKILEALKWRYATKKFDTNKSIGVEELKVLKESVRMSPTSYGLQAFKLINIENAEVRKQLQEAAYGQSAVSECSSFFLLAAQTNIKSEEVDKHMSQLAKAKGVEFEDMQGYGNFVKQSIEGMSETNLLSWNQKQCYIALGMLLESAALMQIDALPMEGFSADKFNEILELDKKGLTATVCCALGYRASEDGNQHFKKVRKSSDDFEITI